MNGGDRMSGYSDPDATENLATLDQLLAERNAINARARTTRTMSQRDAMQLQSVLATIKVEAARPDSRTHQMIYSHGRLSTQIANAVELEESGRFVFVDIKVTDPARVAQKGGDTSVEWGAIYLTRTPEDCGCTTCSYFTGVV